MDPGLVWAVLGVITSSAPPPARLLGSLLTTGALAAGTLTVTAAPLRPRVTWTAASDLDVDHLVALAEAWDSGVRNWTTSRRQSFAKDLGDIRSLVAVTDDVNRSKGDQAPATWLPTYDRCRFILEWTAAKIRWNPTVDTTEKSSLTSLGAPVQQRHPDGLDRLTHPYAGSASGQLTCGGDPTAPVDAHVCRQ